jgi:hypothetical protein
MADLLLSVKKLALSPYFVNANFNKPKKMRVRSVWNDLPQFYNVFSGGKSTQYVWYT